MNAHDERLLHVALTERIGGIAPPDLSERILSRVRLQGATRTSPRRVAAAVAAVLVAAALGVLAPDWTRGRPLPPVATAELTTRERESIDAWLSAQRIDLGRVDPADPASFEPLKAAAAARASLIDLATGKPVAWDHLRERALPLPRDRTQRGFVLEVLAHAPGSARDPVIERQLRDAPEVLRPAVLVLLAERGNPTAHATVVRLATGSRRDPDAIWPAVYLALRGDGGGRDVLRWFLEHPVLGPADPRGALACGAGLHRVGDDTAWRRAVDLAAGAARAALDAGDLARARRVVAALQYFDRAVERTTALPVGDADRRLRAQERGLAAELSDSASIRRRLATFQR